MKKIVIVLLIVIMSSMCHATIDYTAEQLEVNLIINGKFRITRESEYSSVKYIIANLSFVPREYYRQEALNVDMEPDLYDSDGTYVFRWESPDFGEHEFKINADLRLKNTRKKVESKVKFPLENLHEDMSMYISPSATVDSDNDDIIKLANELAEGEDDLFIVVHKLAEWTKNNIEYNLSTLTASVSEPASWVLDNREGVCDEITNLFLAFCRSLGIPARFAAGIAYTDSELFTEKWGPHGWAEVYFPGYGWVDYDVTYGQFGYIDATHIKLKDSVDSVETSAKYSWYGRNIDVKIEEMKIEAVLNKYIGTTEDNVEITVEMEKNEIGFNSYNIVNVNIKNPNDYYVSEEIGIFKTKETEVEGSRTKNVLLMPKSETTVSWLISIGELEKGYIYTFPISVRNARNETFRDFFKAIPNSARFTRKELEELLESRKEEREKKYSRDIKLSCEAERGEFYVFEENSVECTVRNMGNVYFKDMKVCLKDNCQKIELGISQSKNVEFPLEDKEAGRKERMVEARAEDAVKSTFFNYTVLDMPMINITGISAPESVRYRDEYTFEFFLAKKSFSNAYDVEIILNQDGYQKSWTIDEMTDDRKFVINMSGSNLAAGMNPLTLTVKYKDKTGNEYTEEANVQIELVKLTFSERISVFFNSLIRRMTTKRGMIESVIFITLIFIIAFLFIFTRVKHAKRTESQLDGDNRK